MAVSSEPRRSEDPRPSEDPWRNGADPEPVDFRVLFESTPARYLVMDPSLRIVAANDAYLAATMTRREDIVGRELFDVFPDNPVDPQATAAAYLRASLGRVQAGLQPDTMAVQRSDIRLPASEAGGFEVRYWSTVNSPVLGPDGRLRYIIHRIEDVTEFARLHAPDGDVLERGEELRSRATRMELELFERSRELEEANRALRAADETMKGFALALAEASTGLDSVLEAGARTAAELTGGGAVVILAAEDGSVESHAVHDPDSEIAEVLRALVPRLAQTGRSVGGGRPILGPLVDVVQLPAGVTAGPGRAVERVDLHDAVAAALAVEGEYLGCLLLVRHVNERQFGKKDLDQAADVAVRLSLAIFAARSAQRLHQSLDQLRRSGERYRRVVETLGEAVWELDESGVTTFANERLVQLLGVDRDEVIGVPAGRFLEPADRPVLEAQMRVCDEGSDAPYDLRLVCSDGTVVHTRATTTVVRQPGRTHYVHLLTDVTDRIRAEQLQRQLGQMNRLDSLGQLAGGIAHDFNNLLVVVGGFAQVLLERLGPDSPLAPLAGQIVSAATRGSELTGQLLAFGRGSTGQAEVLDVQRVLQELEPILCRTLGEHISLVIPAGGGEATWPVLVNRGRLEQAVVNLAANARDAMPAGGRLTIECANTFLDTTALEENTGQAEARFVRLAVSDTGQGMDAETQQRALEPFFTTKAPGKGTGLGLATVYGMVRSAGGYVQLYSELGVGTTVKIYLPAAPREALPRVGPDSPPQPAAAEAKRTLPSLRTRVLVVEDQPEVAELIGELLRPLGCIVTIAIRPGQALQHITDGLDIDLVLSDVIMPEMTGPELVEAIHAKRPGVPVVYMSGYTAGVLGEPGPLPRGAELVEKPFTRATLLAAMSRALGATDLPPLSLPGARRERCPADHAATANERER